MLIGLVIFQPVFEVLGKANQRQWFSIIAQLDGIALLVAACRASNNAKETSDGCPIFSREALINGEF